MYAFFAQGTPGSDAYTVLHPLLALGNGLAVVFFIAGLVGLFSRYFAKYSAVGRYLSDAAYWVFLAHQPLLTLLAIPMFHWPLPPLLKFLLVTSATTVLCLLSYHYCVRGRRVGRLLGERFAPLSAPH